MKCNAYHTRKRNRYLDPTTVAHLTGKWPENNGTIEEEYGVCYGTKECDECSCGGDRVRCDFYPKVSLKSRVLESCETRLIQAKDNLLYSKGNDDTLRKKRNQVEVCEYILEAVKQYKE
ncbi:hypothetical protein SDC9_46819 [bioreactor metagenome]|uniref:Uncharacterized protein n=1 Tax=bioreactor metagenome TaxID=1076179 RepID=A0A644WA24_9ZZZZ